MERRDTLALLTPEQRERFYGVIARQRQPASTAEREKLLTWMRLEEREQFDKLLGQLGPHHPARQLTPEGDKAALRLAIAQIDRPSEALAELEAVPEARRALEWFAARGPRFVRRLSRSGS